MGRYCCARLLAYHALYHWEGRLRSRLRQEIKRALATVGRLRMGLRVEQGFLEHGIVGWSRRDLCFPS